MKFSSLISLSATVSNFGLLSESAKIHAFVMKLLSDKYLKHHKVSHEKNQWLLNSASVQEKRKQIIYK